MNNGDGTFTNQSHQSLKHQSYSAMGIDVADFNNDTWSDLMVLDMLPQDPRRRRLISNSKTQHQGMWQYGHNTLQLNNGLSPDGNVSFSEVAQLVDVEATGWSWAPLLPQTGSWAPPSPGISKGAAFGDLDRDGDLDLVTNNINEEATLLENRTRDPGSEHDSAHALRVRLRGPNGNRAGPGATLTLTNDSSVQYYDHSLYRGYQSTVEGIVHFGLGADSLADSLEVAWPDGNVQHFSDVPAGQVLDVRYDSSLQQRTRALAQPRASFLFREVSEERRLSYHHEEQSGGVFKKPLLPHSYAQNGPGIAVGDVDDNGLDDVFVGADPRQRRQLFLQDESGRFNKQALPVEPSAQRSGAEDMGALFFDAEGDGDTDLYVISGGSPAPAGREAYQDRLYLNDGTENDGGVSFQRAQGALPELTSSGSVVTAADYDEDGDLDLFVGGRVVPGKYPLPPRSYLLRTDSEDGNVRFTDVTEAVAPAVAKAGLISDALWTDYNGDGDIDLMVAGEWMPLSVFKNESGESEGPRFVEATGEVGLKGTDGWWNGLVAGNFDRDGDTDYVAGNLGLNTRYEASPSEPVRIHAKDFDQNGSIDPVLSRYIQGTRYPAHGYSEMTEQMFALRGRFSTYAEYAEASFDEVFTASELEDAYEATAVRFETSYLENRGDGTFEVRALPRRVQTAPVFGMQSGDYDGDGHLDVLMVGNWYAPDSETGRADAFIGMYMRGDGTGHFAPESGTESGFFVDGDAKGVSELVKRNGNPVVLATQNDGPLKAFTSTHRRGRSVALRPLDRYALLVFDDGSTRKEELYYGSSYLSQSSRTLWIPPTVKEVTIHSSDGSSRTIAPENIASFKRGR